MSRASDRAAVKAALEATDLFQAVIAGWPRRLKGQTPVAVIVGMGSDPQRVARSAGIVEHLLAAWVLTLREPARGAIDGIPTPPHPAPRRSTSLSRRPGCWRSTTRS